MDVSKIKEEYDSLSDEDKAGLNYTGDWELDKNRFIKEYKKNISAMSDFFLGSIADDVEENI